MDNEYKVSWIDTNPQNSSMAEQYVLKKHSGKKQEKKETAEDMYEKSVQNRKPVFLSKYELKNMLNFVLKSLPRTTSSELLLDVSTGFSYYLCGK